MPTILTPTSVFPGLLTPVANPQPIEAEPTSATTDDVDADAPEADAPAAEAEAPAVDESPIAGDDPDAPDPAALGSAMESVTASLHTLAQDAAVDLVAIFKAEIAAYMPELIAQVVAAVKPRRGRPPGSKNRVKAEAAAPARKSGGRKPGRKSKRGRKAR